MEVNIEFSVTKTTVLPVTVNLFENDYNNFTFLFYIEFSNRKVKTFCREIKLSLFAINRFNVQPKVFLGMQTILLKGRTVYNETSSHSVIREKREITFINR